MSERSTGPEPQINNKRDKEPIHSYHLVDNIFEWNNEFITEEERRDLAAEVFKVSPAEGVVLIIEFLRQKGMPGVDDAFEKALRSDV